ncbi:NXPE family member 3-like [Callorhinchus milii]|uniref:NXPE family member 3-like n=1 Tax=Callorhinchus milii TaxID=7868 RepID=UPI001C3FCABC|nr:NXPE family member 3-like [Callorhinchus milii]
MVYDMGAPSPTGMGERLTKMSYSFAKYRILFTLVVTIAILILIMNIHHMQDTHSTTLKTAPYSKDFAFPRSYQSLKQKIQMKKVVATVKPMICHYQNQSSVPEERSEEMFLLKMIEWPMPPQARTPFMNSTDPKHSHFLILNSQNTFHVGDQLQVMVHMYDFSGNPKQYGGDYLQARIHTPELKAGSVGTVVDYLNGSYKINFTLFWPGKVEVSVTLVHPSEGIQVLQRLRDERPDKVYFKSLFRSGSVQETTMCSVCLPETAPLCNFTDLKTGERWFCYKPKKLPCTTRLNHAKGGYKKGLLKGAEGRFLTSKVNLQQPVLPSGPGFVNVKASTHAGANLRRCVRGKSLASPSGFYYQDQWMSATCNIHRFNTPNITACLRKKIVHLFGDSTIRQWFEYLTKFQPGLKRFPLGNNENTGPHLAIDMKNQIMVKYHCHAPPIRFYIETPNMLYIANALDECMLIMAFNGVGTIPEDWERFMMSTEAVFETENINVFITCTRCSFACNQMIQYEM